MDNTLVISDTHFPHHHPDTFEFLEALAYSYDIKLVKSVGDLIDNHNSSFHEIEYGTMSPQEEHKAAYACIQRLSKMFPKMDIVLGNHDIMTHRKAKTVGISLDHIKSYNDVYDVKWNWQDKDFFKIDKYTECLMIHSMGANTLSNARSHSHCSIQGHHHGKFGIEYFGDTNMLRWSMSVGCLIDTSNPAFNYGSKATLNRPIIGCGGIIDNEPRLFKMQLNKKGRWVGEL